MTLEEAIEVFEALRSLQVDPDESSRDLQREVFERLAFTPASEEELIESAIHALSIVALYAFNDSADDVSTSLNKIADVCNTDQINDALYLFEADSFVSLKASLSSKDVLTSKLKQRINGLLELPEFMKRRSDNDGTRPVGPNII